MEISLWQFHDVIEELGFPLDCSSNCDNEDEMTKQQWDYHKAKCWKSSSKRNTPICFCS